MSKEVEKPVKVFLCVVLGLLLTALLGHPNSITVPVTALLVVGTGQGASERGVRVYMARRVAIQVLGSALLLLPLLGLKRWLDMPPWATVLLACLLPLAVLFYLDYRLKISPMYITSVCVSTLILATGTIQAGHYPLIRILLVSTGCLLGYVLSVVVLPRDPGSDAARLMDRAMTLLEACVRAGDRGEAAEMRGLLDQAGDLFQSARASLGAMGPGEDREALVQRWEALRSLAHLLGSWMRHMASFTARSELEQADWRTGLDRVLEEYRTLDQGAPDLTAVVELEMLLLGGLVRGKN